jgi:predicted O-methyltransferase YrrM
MPEPEGLTLHRAALDLEVPGPLLEVGGYCGLSALYLGDAARLAHRVLYSIDHHRGSEENQAGWEHHDPAVVDPRTGRIDTLPFFRRTIEEAELEEQVVAVVGHSQVVAAAWSTPLAMLFIDGGHAEVVATADYEAWSGLVVTGGVLAIHDVFEDPSAGGQAPFHVWQLAIAEGFEPVGSEGSLRLLRRREGPRRRG